MKVPLYDDEVCIGQVAYIDNLDRWDGGNYTSGSVGRHLGIGKTADGRFYLVHGTQWQGEHDRAEIVSEAEARSQVAAHGDDALHQSLFGEPIPDL